MSAAYAVGVSGMQADVEEVVGGGGSETGVDGILGLFSSRSLMIASCPFFFGV